MTTISVIIPVYQSRAYLRRCLDTVLGQSHAELEVILVDDGSTDGSGELCEEVAGEDGRVRVVHQANGGIAAARNAGLDLATGEAIGFVDSDDWVEPGMYAYLLGLMEAHQADIAEAMLDVVYAPGRPPAQPPERLQVLEGEAILVRYLEHNEFAMGLRLYRRHIFDGLRFEAGRINEDVAAGFEALSRASRLVASNQVLYHYYSNPAGISESPLRLRDLDLLHAGERLDGLTAQGAGPKLRRLALTKRWRAPFTLLIKLAVFGCSPELDEAGTIRFLKAQLRGRYGFLLRSNMPLNRKLLLVGCRVCYPLVRLAGRAYAALTGARRAHGDKDEAGMTSVLLVEDDPGIARHLGQLLTAEGYEVSQAAGRQAALDALSARRFELLLVDVSLPDGSGYAVCTAAKRSSDAAVVFLTASDDEASVVTGLELGADDYIVKPFRPLELLSRLKAVLRRGGQAQTLLKAQDLTVDAVRGTVYKGSAEVFLSALEYKLLLAFMNNPGAVLTRDRLEDEVWSVAGGFVNDNTLTVYVKRLREKLEDDPQRPSLITTVRGLGYRLEA